MVRKVLFVALCVLCITLFGALIVEAQGPAPRAPVALAGTAFTYQGQLKNGGAPVNATCDFQFGLWDASAAGTQLGFTQTIASAVTNGLFTASIDFGAERFNGDARWLASAVRCPSGSGSYTGLNPRQALTPAPMAFALPGLYTQQKATSPNIIGGYSGNTVGMATIGATISGGGDSSGENQALGNFSNIGGGKSNNASFSFATVSGGFNNTASGYGATVGGGQDNTASGYYSTVPGGRDNSAIMTMTLAAGYKAKANHQGAFVWADYINADFASTGNNQFLIRANGGVGINGASFVTTTNALQVDKGNIMVRGTNNFAGLNDQAILYLGDTNQYIKSVFGSGLRIGTYGVVDAIALQELSGNVGIGTTSPADKLTVVGDARVGTSGTNGCVKRFDGTAIAGSCSSDARLKKNIEPFAAMLDPVSQLRPVHYSWRAEEFPQYGFGANTPSYGLIAQEVERVLPELVGQDEHGFKTVNYSELPLVMLQAMKELRAEKDAQIADLQARLAALEQNANARHNVNITYDVNVWLVVALCIGAFALYRGKRGQP
jgi:hypothetical protein